MKKTSSAVTRVYHLSDPDERVPVSNLFQVFHELLGVVCFPTDIVLGTTLNGNIIHRCYLPAGRSVLGKSVPEFLTSRPRAQFFPIRADLGRQIACLFFSSVEYFVSSFSVEFSLQPFSTRAFDI